ncbi:MAG TPA: aminodeoxychorismate lyase [Marinagarivorans sp.]
MVTDSANSHALWQVNNLRGGLIPVADRGLAYGDGLFETMYFCKSRCALLDWHRQRLLSGCERLRIPLTQDCFEQQLQQFLAGIGAQQMASLSENTSPLAGIVKLIVTRGVGGRGYVPASAPQPQLIWQWSPFSVSQASSDEASQRANDGVCLSLSDVRLAKQPLLAGLKHLNRLEYVLAAQQACDNAMPLLLDSDDHVVEALSHNIFMVSAGQLITPALTACGVDGVLRQFTRQQLAPRLNIQWREDVVTWDALLSADEVFIGNSVRGFWPVVAIKSADLEQTWSVGPVCQQLQHSHQQYLHSIHG